MYQITPTTAFSNDAACRSAVALMGYSRSQWPKALLEYYVIDGILDNSLRFAIAARRVIDHLSLSIEIDETTLHLAGFEGLAPETTNLKFALNGIIHSHDLKVVSSEVSPDYSTYQDVQSYMPSSLLFVTDQRREGRISIYDMAVAYLRNVTPSSK